MEQNPIDVARVLLSFSVEEIQDTYTLENLRYLHTLLTGFPPSLSIQSKYVLTRVLLSTSRYLVDNMIPNISQWDMFKIAIEMSMQELDEIAVEELNKNKIALMRVALTGLLQLADELSE